METLDTLKRGLIVPKNNAKGILENLSRGMWMEDELPTLPHLSKRSVASARTMHSSCHVVMGSNGISNNNKPMLTDARKTDINYVCLSTNYFI